MDNDYETKWLPQRAAAETGVYEQPWGPREHDLEVYQGSQLDLRFFGGGVEHVSIVEGNVCVDFVNGGRIVCATDVIWIEPERQ